MPATVLLHIFQSCELIEVCDYKYQTIIRNPISYFIDSYIQGIAHSA